MTSKLFLFLLATVACAEDAKAKKEEPAASKKASTLAPLIKYVDVWLHVHSRDAGIPKLLLLLDDEEANEAPSWFSTAAMKYKEGRTKKVAFVAIKGGKDAKSAATRFGLTEGVPEGGTLIMAVPADDGGYYKRFDKRLSEGGAGERSRAVRAFVDGVLAGVPEEERSPLPSFPEPTRPRKAAPVTLEEFTHETLPLRCYGVQAKPLCIFAIQPNEAGFGCQHNIAALAKRHANDPISFGCVGAAKQGAFLAAFGIEPSELPTVVAVKAGKRPRFARLEGGLAGAGAAVVKRLNLQPGAKKPNGFVSPASNYVQITSFRLLPHEP
jgi:hypothetical protein